MIGTTVRQLIKALENWDPDREVCTTSRIRQGTNITAINLVGEDKHGNLVITYDDDLKNHSSAVATPKPKPHRPVQGGTTTYEFFRAFDHESRDAAKESGGLYECDLPSSLSEKEIDAFASFIAEGVLGTGDSIAFRARNCEIGGNPPALGFFDQAEAGTWRQAVKLGCESYLNGNFYGSTAQIGDISGLVDTINDCLKQQNDIECVVKNIDGDYIPIGEALVDGESPWS